MTSKPTNSMELVGFFYLLLGVNYEPDSGWITNVHSSGLM